MQGDLEGCSDPSSDRSPLMLATHRDARVKRQPTGPRSLGKAAKLARSDRKTG